MKVTFTIPCCFWLFLPWNLKELNKCPDFEWSEGKKIRSLFFKSESYKGKTTRVFVYYATIWFLTVKDERERIVSSTLVFPRVKDFAPNVVN